MVPGAFVLGEPDTGNNDARFSPDGRRIAYLTGAPFPTEIGDHRSAWWIARGVAASSSWKLTRARPSNHPVLVARRQADRRGLHRSRETPAVLVVDAENGGPRSPAHTTAQKPDEGDVGRHDRLAVIVAPRGSPPSAAPGSRTSSPRACALISRAPRVFGRSRRSAARSPARCSGTPRRTRRRISARVPGCGPGGTP